MADFAGTIGPDDWLGTSDAETAHGGEGEDTLKGAGGNDSVFGEGGNDVLWGGTGVDLLDGGAGDDRLVIFLDQYGPWDLEPGDQFIGGSGTDELYFTANGATVDIVDLTGFTISADIERLNAAQGTAQLTLSQLQQFSRVVGAVKLTTSGTIDLSGNRFADGRLYFAGGNDIVTLAGNMPIYSISLDGGGGNDHLIATEHHDVLLGGDGNDKLEGRGGIDALEGGAGDDILLGGDGDDNLFDDAGADILDGGAGDDTFHINYQQGFSAADQLIGGAGVDSIWVGGLLPGQVIDLASIPDDIEGLLAGSATVIATAEQLSRFQRLEVQRLQVTTGGNFVLSGTFSFGALKLSDFSSSVDLSGATGFGGSYVDGGAGADTIIGSNGVDYFTGGGGNDVIHGGGVFDQLIGGAGIDWLDGGAGDDRLMVDDGEPVEAGDRFTGGTGIDTLLLQGGGSTSPPVDLRIATIDADVEILDARRPLTIANAQLAAFSQIYGMAAIQLASGGSIDFTGKQTSGTLLLADAATEVILSATGFHVTGGAGDDRIIGAAMTGAATLAGGGGNDFVSGGEGNDDLIGGDGSDRLEGGGGHDNLDGGAGADILVGGTGSDYYRVDSAGDQVVELVGQGHDHVVATASYALAADAEVEVLEAEFGSTNAIDLTGSSLNNTLFGNQAANRLDGGAGDDYMMGRGGDDSYVVDSTGDVIVEEPGQGIDTVLTTISYTLEAAPMLESLRALDPAATTNLSLTGNGNGNVIVGNAGANVIDGKAGDDRLEGGGGNDLLYSGDGNDRLFGDGGNDGLFFGAQFAAGDVADGGGDTDTLALQGNYANLLLANVSNVELLLLLAGNDTRFGDTAGNSYDYGFLAPDSLVAAGATLSVIGGNLRPGEDLVFNGSAETNGHFRIFAGQSVDSLRGGGGNDGFFFGADGNLTAGDRIIGGAGTDSIALRGNHVGPTAVVFQEGSFSEIEVLTFLSGHTKEFGGFIDANGFDYDVTLANGNIAAGLRLDVIATNLRANESARVDARAELDGAVRILTGAGDDILFGGAGNDTLSGGLGVDALDGGAGDDIYVYRSSTESTAAARDTIAFTGGDKIDLALIDANVGTTGINEAFAVIGDAAFSGVAGQLRLFQSDGHWIVEGDVNGDSVADLVIAVGSAAPLTASDFLL